MSWLLSMPVRRDRCLSAGLFDSLHREWLLLSLLVITICTEVALMSASAREISAFSPPVRISRRLLSNAVMHAFWSPALLRERPIS